jgi:uncharacterized membrane protein YbhN (UPF0104 family)
MPNWIKTLLKVAGSSVALYFAVSAIDTQAISGVSKSIDFLWVLPALVLYIASQALSAIRLNALFRSHDILMTQGENMKLYLVGMLYNFLIPGGIGGDGYKTVVIKRATGGKTLDLAKLLVVDRSFGLLGLFGAGAMLLTYTPFPVSFKLIGWGVVFLSVGLGTFLVTKFVKRSKPQFWKLTGLSLIIQWLQIASVIALLYSISAGTAANFYGLAFLASSLASVFPLSIGGIGIRELAFVYGAKYGMLNEAYALFLSLGFLLMTIVVSVIGFPVSLMKKEWEINVEPDPARKG